MTELTDLSETDADNVLITEANIAEGCSPSGINNAIRNMAGLIRRAFKSSIFRLRDSTDQTKLLALDLSGITTGTTRTLTVGAAGTIATTTGTASIAVTTISASSTALAGTSTASSDGSVGTPVLQSRGVSGSYAAALFRMQGNSDPYVGFYREGTGLVGLITGNGAGGVNYNTTSDARLKHLIEQVGEDEALHLLGELNPIWFEYKATPGRLFMGFLAASVQQVCPWLVTGEPDGEIDIGTATLDGVITEGVTEQQAPAGSVWTKTGTQPVYQVMDYGQLTPLLTAGLKAEMGRRISLEATVQSLSDRLAAAGL